jgi:hypothetical protein
MHLSPITRSLSAGILALFGALFPTREASAWPWKIEPQPALHGREAIWSDADSPLAWDASWRVLWHLHYGQLKGAFWSGHTLVPIAIDAITPKPQAGMLVDPALHFLYCADAGGIPHCVRREGGTWRADAMGSRPVARFLAVDSRQRGVFAYDAAEAGIRLFLYDAKAKTWSSRVIAKGLGRAEEAGAFDPTLRILFTTHATAHSSIPRHPQARTVADPTGIGAWQPWPLVATAWDAGSWRSRVLDETGVPQQPAVRMTDHRVFYGERDDPDGVRFYQRARAGRPESFGRLADWDGTDTWVDHHHYEIRAPSYPDSWGASGNVSVTWTHTVPAAEVILRKPVTVVPYYEPLWTDTALTTRLVRFRAAINPRSGHLVQHRLRAEGEVVRAQTGQRLAGYLYRDANGVLAKEGRTNSSLFAGTATGLGYPTLGPDFDPANPPTDFSTLTKEGLAFVTYRQHTSLQRPTDTYSTSSYGAQIPPHFSTDADAPWVAAHLRSPSVVHSRNFGYRHTSPMKRQPGGRYREFTGGSTSLAAASHLAVDGGAGVSFYTQAPEPGSGEAELALPYAFQPFSATPLTGFSPEPERKLPKIRQSVWIVMVY